MTTTKKKPTQKKEATPEKGSRAITITLIMVPILVIGWVTGYVPYVISFVRCGKEPVSATRFAAANSYYVPGQVGSGPGPFKEYFCSIQEAEDAQYSRYGS